MTEKVQEINMGTDPIKPLLFKMGLPIMLGMLFTALDNIGDAFFISKLGVSQLSAILICAPIGQAVVALGLLFGNGAGAYIPRLLGAKKMEEANKVASTAIYGSLFLGILAILLIMFNLESLLRFLGGTKENLNFALDYAKIYVPSLILNIYIVTMNSLNSSEGKAKLVLIVNSLTAVLNFILNPLFIYTFQMGIAGAAFATVVAQSMAILVLVLNILMKNSVFNFKFSEIDLGKNILLPVFKVGISTLAFQVLTSISITLTNIQAREYGDSFIAGMGSVTRIVSLSTLMVFGFIKGFQAVAGFNFGAKKYDRLAEAIKVSIIWSTAFCVIFGITMMMFPTQIISIFSTGSTEMVRIGAKALRIIGLSFMLFGFHTVYSSLFLALGRVKEGFFLGICRQGICFIPVILMLPQVLGTKGIIYSQPIADILTAVITLFMAIVLQKQLNNLRLPSISMEKISR
ncbi:MATE family efflux transporter [Enterococcus alishanensis]